jgi:CRISPR-associated endonuclease Csn1
MDLIYGFDIGTTSIGWAVIRLSRNDAQGQLLGMGTRVFPEARDSDGTPLNQQRRLARMMRRQYRRRRVRRRQLNELLSGVGLLPSFGGSEWGAMSRGPDPYALRAEGLTRQLSPHELGRALYHLAKRRHFRGRDIEEQEDGKEDAAEEKKAKSARETTIAALKSSGQTLGAYLAAIPAGSRKRGVHALRDHVRAEFEALLLAQRPHHPALQDGAFTAALSEAIFAQKPVFWRKNTLGQCKLMPDSPLASKASWASCQRRMLEQLNNLAIAGGNQRPLEADERAAILAALQTQGSMTWGGVRKVLEPLFKARGQSARTVRFNLEEGGNPKLLGNPLEAKLAAVFGPDWESHPHKHAIREATDTRLRDADYGSIGQRVVILPEAERKARRGKAAESFIKDFGVTPGQARELEAMSFPVGWDAYSTDAIARLMPELERGVRLGSLLAGPEWNAWRHGNFPNRNRPTGEFLDRLPSPRDRDEAKRMRGIRNPTVNRVLNELRKVVNNLISVHGKPDLIRIELARDIGLSKREREEKSKAMRKQETQRKKALNDLRANDIAEPARRDIEKWLLWKESGERDPYSGDMVSFDALFRNNEYEIEHIWPRSLSLDDSLSNLTLCRRDLNQRKSKRIPFDAFGSDPDLWTAITARIEEMKAGKGKAGMSPRKARRFIATAIPEDFASRQLNDTGYAAREALASLKRLWPDEGPEAPVRVQAVTGKVTAYLRRLWGLNNILSDDGEKTRADHRHHAVDALAVACTHPGMSQRLSRYWQMEDSPQGGALHPRLDPPWPSIRREAEEQVAKIVVSHRVRKKLSGALHKGKIYGDTTIDEVSSKTTYRLFTFRKPVEELSKTEMGDVRDPVIKKILTDWVAERGGDPKKAYPPYPRVTPDGPEIRNARVFFKQQMTLMGKATTGYADLGSNHHVAIYRKPSGEPEFEVVSLYEAVRRLKANEPVVRRDRSDAQFVMSLSLGDTIMLPEGHDKGRLRVVQSIWASGVVVTLSNTDALGETVWRPSAGSLLSMGARKISVDPIGRIREARD